MKIDLLIIRDLGRVCVIEEIGFVNECLKNLSYLLVVSERMVPLGIVTKGDVEANPGTELRYLDLDKPGITHETNIKQAYEVMQISGTDVLPVYHCRRLIGVITLEDVQNSFVYKLIPGPIASGFKPGFILKSN